MTTCFIPLTYEGIDLSSVVDPRRRAAFELQIDEFGQTPRRLFSTHHPPRDGPLAVDPVPPPGEEASSRREAGADVGAGPGREAGPDTRDEARAAAGTRPVSDGGFNKSAGPFPEVAALPAGLRGSKAAAAPDETHQTRPQKDIAAAPRRANRYFLCCG